uniref:DUF4283 domain-containing protein n=1 Tax=Cannabis sativa TaxID=3483 RepID=A0A803Q7V1_CANSA
MEANVWVPEVNKSFIIIDATMVEARDVTRDSSRRHLRGLWFYIYIVRLRYCFSYPSPCFLVTFSMYVWVLFFLKMDEFLNTVSSALVFPPDENTIFTYDASSSTSSPATISLLLKLHTIRPYNHLSLMKTLSSIWSSQCRFPVSVTKHADGLFLITFGCDGDKGRILEGQPWHFAQSITIFAAPESSFPVTSENLHYVHFWIQAYGIPFMYKSYDLARFIASEIGDLIEVDKDTVKEGTSPYLRLRILLDVNLPIRRETLRSMFAEYGEMFTPSTNDSGSQTPSQTSSNVSELRSLNDEDIGVKQLWYLQQQAKQCGGTEVDTYFVEQTEDPTSDDFDILG